MRRRRLAPLLAAAVLLAVPAAAQGPSAEWRTLETAHFRFHFPADSEVWTRHAAARVEAVRARVVAEVGYEPPQKVDVLIADPVAAPNGAAVPFLGRPRLVLWTSPPPPDSSIGTYRDWTEMLLVHEETHLVHLLRPSRNPLRRRLAGLLPVGPIPLAAPRWAIEGYATLVEGRLTGAGRPYGDLRAAILRRRALAGRLPGYAALSRDDDTWQGASMAYLAGSAFLEWLEARGGPGSLPKVWARLTARQARSFDEAFRGVFGDGPQELYGRFTAELTHHAVEAERRLAAAGSTVEREGELWQDLEEGTGAPAVAPAGDRVVAVRRERDEPSELVVWATALDEAAERERREEAERIARRDPEDVPAVRTGPPPREELDTLALDPGPEMPRFLPDGESVLFVRFVPDGEGFLHPDLFRWWPEEGSVERLTRGADLRDPDPFPDGRSAVATRVRHGLSQSVRVDLESGEVEPITEPSLEPVDRPRVSPDGRRVAFARHAAEPSSEVILSEAKDLGGEKAASREESATWELVVRDLSTGSDTVLSLPAGGSASDPAWSADGRTLFAAVGMGGFVDLWAFPLDPPGPPVRLTRTIGAALSPAPTPDGKALFYLSLDVDGLDLYRLELPQPLAARTFPPVETGDLVPAVPPAPPPEVAPFALAEPGPSRPYGLGRPEPLVLTGGASGSAGDVWEAGARVGDVVGRYDLLALGGGGDAGPRGGALAGAWRGWPVELSAHLFQVEERPSRQQGVANVPAVPDVDPGTGRPPSSPAPGIPVRGLDAERRGIELASGWRRQGLNSSVRLSPGLFVGEVEPLPDTAKDEAGSRSLDQQALFLSAEWEALRRRGRWTFAPAAYARWDEGETNGDSWSRWRAAAGLGLAHVDTGALGLTWQRGRVSGARQPWDRFQVGGPGSSLLPESVLSLRLLSPALPAGILLGDEVESQRVELALDLLPLPLFAERHRVATGGAWGEWLRVAGVEWSYTLDPLPIAGIPAFDLRLGAARVLEPPLEGDDRWWVTVVFRP